ncbi:hypothetical protein VTI28DRAFT_6397 [Corynascus sepedonium]
MHSQMLRALSLYYSGGELHLAFPQPAFDKPRGLISCAPLYENRTRQRGKGNTLLKILMELNGNPRYPRWCRVPHGGWAWCVKVSSKEQWTQIRCK